MKIDLIAKHFKIEPTDVETVLMEYGEVIYQNLVYHDHIDARYFSELMVADKYYKSLILQIEVVLELSSALIPFGRELWLYFLLDGSVVVYIGQTKEICKEIAEHQVDKHFNKIANFKISNKRLFMVEAVNILYHNPYYNQGRMDEVEYFRQVVKRVDYKG